MGEDDKPSRLGAAAAPAAAWHDGSGGGGGRGGAASGAGASSSVGPAANALGATAGCDELSCEWCDPMTRVHCGWQPLRSYKGAQRTAARLRV